MLCLHYKSFKKKCRPYFERNTALCFCQIFTRHIVLHFFSTAALFIPTSNYVTVVILKNLMVFVCTTSLSKKSADHISNVTPHFFSAKLFTRHIVLHFFSTAALFIPTSYYVTVDILKNLMGFVCTTSLSKKVQTIFRT